MPILLKYLKSDIKHYLIYYSTTEIFIFDKNIMDDNKKLEISTTYNQTCTNYYLIKITLLFSSERILKNIKNY